jgi:hypothetical protein
MHTHTHTCTHTHTHTQLLRGWQYFRGWQKGLGFRNTYMCQAPLSPPHTYTLSPAHVQTLSHTHTHSLPHTYANLRTNALTHALARAHTHTDTHTQTHTCVYTSFIKQANSFVIATIFHLSTFVFSAPCPQATLVTGTKLNYYYCYYYARYDRAKLNYDPNPYTSQIRTKHGTQTPTHPKSEQNMGLKTLQIPKQISTPNIKP